nr:MAG TPA: hypothetical protein [Bacteriophage sp.]
MRKGGFRKKMNLDLSPEDFSKLSLREANEIIDRLAKRYNQRVKEFYKFNPYASLKIYEYNKAEVGKPVFSRSKSKTINEARSRYAQLQGFSQSKYSSISAYKSAQRKAVETLAKNTGLEVLDEKEKAELAGFFDYIYDTLKMNASDYNYKELAEFFSVYKLTAEEQEERKKTVQDMWREFKSGDETMAEFLANQKLALKSSGALAKGDTRTFSQIIRDSFKED